jgi:hypothetical protein
MATTDDLIISIRADMGRLESQLRDVNSQLRGTERQGNETANAIKGMAVQFLSLGAAIEGLKKLVDVNREFGILKAGLETATGSAQGANDAFIALQDFAKTTPYDLAQATSAFTQLVNLGLTPSERALKSYGDTSAALGKDLKQMVEAVADAATGEFERLKEFGIKSKNQGDTIAFTFKGTTETVKNNAAAIEEYLIKLGEVNFDGAMKKRMDSLDGAISNLGDAWDAFFYQLGQAGGTDVLKDAFTAVGDALNEVNAMLSSGEMQGYIEAIGLSFQQWTDDIKIFTEGTSIFIEQWAGDNKESIAGLRDFLKDAFLELPQNLHAIFDLMANELKDFVRDSEIYGRKFANFLNPFSPTYDLKGNLAQGEAEYRAAIEKILADRDKVTKQASERKDKAQNDRALDNLLGDWNKEYNTGDRLAGFGMDKKDTKEGESDKDKKAKEKAAKQFEQLKEQAQKELNLILEKNMSEQELEQKRYNEQVASLDKHLKDKTITTSQYLSGIIALNEQADKKTTELMIAQHDAETAINAKNAEEDFAQHAARLEQLGILMDGVRQGGMTELEIMDAQHIEKMQKLTDIAAAEKDLQEVINGVKLEAEAQYQAKRLDLILGTGNKIQTMQRAFEKGNLQGALSFFAADFGGMSQHSRKMFELTKAARLAEAAILLPSTVMTAAEKGTKIGGWPLGLAMGAAAAASQLANLRAIQSASFGGGGGGSSGSAGGGGSVPSAASQGQQEQAPLQQRFVNIGLSGSDNTMYTKDSVRELIKRLNEEVKDGAVLRVN